MWCRKVPWRISCSRSSSCTPMFLLHAFPFPFLLFLLIFAQNSSGIGRWKVEVRKNHRLYILFASISYLMTEWQDSKKCDHQGNIFTKAQHWATLLSGFYLVRHTWWDTFTAWHAPGPNHWKKRRIELFLMATCLSDIHQGLVNILC